MNTIQRFVAIGMACALVSMVPLSAHGASDNDATYKTPVKKHKHLAAARSLASLAPVNAPVTGQGEAMLNDVKSSNPRFLRAPASNSNVRLAGVCHDKDGVMVSSDQRGYSDCLDARTTATGSVSDYFSAQRQAGAGVVVGQ